MSAHDKIDLPPPAGYYYEWDGAYGKRKFTTAPHNGRECDRAVAYYTEEQVRAAIEADRQRRGEPVAWQLRTPEGRVILNKEFPAWADGGDGYKITPLYAAPQPEEQQPAEAQTMPDWGAAPPGATHYQPHQDAYYKRVSASEWYVWSRENDREPMRWHPSLGTGDNAEWVVRPADAQQGWGSRLDSGKEIMVNTFYDVFTLPLQPSGLLSGPRFVVHVPGPEQPAAPDVSALVEALERVLYCNEVGFLPESVQQAVSDALAAYRQGGAE